MDQVHSAHQFSFSWFRNCACLLTNFISLLLTPTLKTASAMTSLFLALVLYPQVQRRAQAELDAVVGRDRLPTFDDRPRLPYIDALCEELMRWQMVTPIGMIRVFPRALSIGMIKRILSGLPHSSNRDDVYKGYFIPKGQILHKLYIMLFVTLPLIIWS